MTRHTALLVGTLASTQAFAQQGPDAHGFQLAAQTGDLRAPLTAQRPNAFSVGDAWAFAALEYAKKPLVAPDGTALLDDVLALDLSVGMAAHERLRFDLSAPMYLVTTAAPDRTTSGPSVGDVRFSALTVLIRPRHTQDGGGLGVGFTAHVDLPVGDETRYLGMGGVSTGARVVATYEWTHFSVDGALGTQINPNQVRDVWSADALFASIGAGVLLFEDLSAHVETNIAPMIPKSATPGMGVPSEALFALRWRSSPELVWTLGTAAGFTSGVGAADYRVFFGAGFGRIAPPPPPDYDPLGLFTSADRCPLADEVFNGYLDDDGCPDELGTFTLRVTYQGEERLGALVTVTHPDGEVETRINTTPVAYEADPDTTWSASARSDGCLAGEVTHTIAPGQRLVELPLALDIDGAVTIDITAPDETPITNARVFWRSDTPLCVPPEAYDVAETGILDHPIGHGSHTVLVTAPDYLPHEEVVVFEYGVPRPLSVVLEPVPVEPVGETAKEEPKPKKPIRVRIEKRKIVIDDKVHFETNKSVIKPESYGLLDEVALVIMTNPQVGRIEVAGHTDSVGSEEYNLELSQRRAESVRAYLVGQGVEPERLLAKGYGETIPVDTNRTAPGRERNRRVEFDLVDEVSEEDGGESP